MQRRRFLWRKKKTVLRYIANTTYTLKSHMFNPFVGENESVMSGVKQPGKI